MNDDFLNDAFGFLKSVAITLVVVVIGLIAERVGHKMNFKANADVQSSYELKRIATALERLADQADRGGLLRPSLLPR